jgi:hypothetical protein
LWRPLAASVVMYFSVLELIAWFGTDNGFLDNAAHLTVAVGFGATVFTVTLWILWCVSGAPDGAEKTVLDTLKLRTSAIAVSFFPKRNKQQG